MEIKDNWMSWGVIKADFDIYPYLNWEFSILKYLDDVQSRKD